jgi:hypothetical protein
MMRAFVSLMVILLTVCTYGQKKSGKPVLPKHSVNAGAMFTTMNNGTGGFLDYQYYLDDQLSYSIKPGLTGIIDNPDSLNICLFVGVNYRLNTLRRPLRDRFFNAQPYAGFYPASIEYVKIETESPEKYRLGWSPTGILGYTLIFSNTISLDLHAGFGMSFRLAGKAGSGFGPSFIAGAGIGYRIR